MAELEASVARHYTHGALERAIRDGLAGLGRSPDAATAEDLAAIDEFHIGGHQATVDLAGRLALAPGLRLLDIGCGIGGAARHFARAHGCRVTGVDLTPEYVEVGRALTRLVGLADRVEHRLGSALDLPVEDGAFDLATLLHVGMNIPDKAALCREACRVLRPGGRFAVYDVMRTGAGAIRFPVPWAGTAETSFVAAPADYRRALAEAGFALEAERDRRNFAIDFFRPMQARLAGSGPPPLGLHVLMGPEAPVKIANMIAMLEEGQIAPVEMIARRPG